MTETNDQQPATESRWQRLWRKPRKKWLLGIPAGGYLLFVIGVAGWTGFNATLDYSNQEEFCVSCHVMRDNVYAEYQNTIHYSNRTGVRAVCADCHVPKEWSAKVGRKVRATMHELPHWLLGTIDTREKFEARRLTLAEHVWERMRTTDSRECRNCHEISHMDLDAQQRTARSKHKAERLQERGETCIDCHQGIAHELPEGWEEYF